MHAWLVSNTLPADPAEVAAAGTGDVTEACADGGRDDCQKPPAGELLGTTYHNGLGNRLFRVSQDPSIVRTNANGRSPFAFAFTFTTLYRPR